MIGAALHAAPSTATQLPVPSPILKWVGGKSRLLPELVARMPSNYDRYIEPFCGGAAVFFHLTPRVAIVSDASADLIDTYRAVVADVEGVIEMLTRHRAAHSELHYYAVRSVFNDRERQWGATKRAAAFIYLNKTCFNGLYRVNRRGMFNVPMGRYVNPTIFDPDELRAASIALARADLRVSDYRTVLADAERGDLVYLDPPYDVQPGVSGFTSYTAKPFAVDEQAALADAAAKLVTRSGCKVMISSSDTTAIRTLYGVRHPGIFQIDEVSRSGSINSDPDKRGAVAELIITGGYAR